MMNKLIPLLALILCACGPPAQLSPCERMETAMDAIASHAMDSTCFDVAVTEWGRVQPYVCDYDLAAACWGLGMALEDAALCEEDIGGVALALDALEAYDELERMDKCR